MPSVNIPYVGVVEFPDTMSSEDISNVIRTQIVPNAPRPDAPTAPPSTDAADTVQRTLYNTINAIPFVGEDLAERVAGKPMVAAGSAGKGLMALGNVLNESRLSTALEMYEGRKGKYGQDYELATPEQKIDFADADKKLNQYLTENEAQKADIKAIEAKYGKDPLAKRVDSLEETPEYKKATGLQQAGMIGKELIKNIDEFPEYVMNIGLGSLPQSIAMALAARFGMAFGAKGAMVAGGGTSAMMEYGSQYVELREQGFDHEQANNKAMVKSGVIGGFDALSLKSAGKLAEQLFNNTTKKAFKETVKEVGKELPEQMAYGAFGEGFGSYLSNQPVNPRAVLEEALGELAGAPAEVAATYKGKREEIANAPPPPSTGVPPVATTTPPTSPTSSTGTGLVEPEDLETAVDTVTTRLQALLDKATTTGTPPSAREVNLLAKELNITPDKDPLKTIDSIVKNIFPTIPNGVLNGTLESPIVATTTTTVDGKESVKTTREDGSVEIDGVLVTPPKTPETPVETPSLTEVQIRQFGSIGTYKLDNDAKLRFAEFAKEHSKKTEDEIRKLLVQSEFGKNLSVTELTQVSKAINADGNIVADQATANAKERVVTETDKLKNKLRSDKMRVEMAEKNVNTAKDVDKFGLPLNEGEVGPKKAAALKNLEDAKQRLAETENAIAQLEKTPAAPVEIPTETPVETVESTPLSFAELPQSSKDLIVDEARKLYQSREIVLPIEQSWDNLPNWKRELFAERVYSGGQDFVNDSDQVYKARREVAELEKNPAAEVETPVEEVKPTEREQAITPLDMGNNTEYRVIKNDQGWAAVLFDKESDNVVGVTVWPFDKFGETGSKQSAIDYAKAQQEKIKHSLEQPTEEISEEDQADLQAELDAEMTGTPVRTQAEINKERQAAQKAAAEKPAAPEPEAPVAETKTQAEINQERQAEQKAAAAPAVETPVAKTPNVNSNKPTAKQRQAQAEQKLFDLLGAKVGDTITFSQDIGYITANKPLVISSISNAGEMSVTDPIRGTGTSEKLSQIQAQAGRGLTWEVTPASSKPKTSAETKTQAEVNQERQATQKAATKPVVSANKVFTEDAAEKARALLKKKLGQLNSGIDPEVLQAGLTLSGYHVEKGARTFAAYAKAMLADMGEMVRPYLKSWYMALKFDPRSEDFSKDMDAEDTVKKADVKSFKAEETKEGIDLLTPDGKFQVGQSIANHFIEGKGFKDITEARRFIADMTGTKIEAGTQAAKEADEAVEVGVVLAARDIAQNTKSPQEAYDKLVSLYNRQPNLSVRSSTSIREQAYSTPAPLAYVASKLAGIDAKTTVYEPTAGNGMLLIDSHLNSVKVTELNSSRYEMLKRVLKGAQVENRNALDFKPSLVDVVIENPPFGALGRTYESSNGVKTNQIDHAIVLHSLGSMKEDGKAVLIIGGSLADTEEGRRKDYQGNQKRNFFYNLYKDYNVVDHFTVAGNMYTKQGTSYPVDVIVIHGKGKSQRALPAANLPEQIKSYLELKGKLNGLSVVSTGNVSTDRTDSGKPAAGTGEPERLGGRTVTEGSGSSNEGDKSTTGSGQGVSETKSGKRVRTEPTGASVSGGQPKPSNKSERVNRDNAVPSASETKQSGSAESDTGNKPRELGGPSAVTGERVESGLKDRRGQEAETGHQVTYNPHSKASAIGTLVPKAMAQSIDQALGVVEELVGSVDEYVANALSTDVKTLRKSFSAEQIDALTLAIRNAEGGKGFIIGDQTGIGKGRVVAAMIKYAIENGKIPIFVTQKDTLYSDMIRDLDDIGMTQVLGLDTDKPKILITNNDLEVPYKLIRPAANGKFVENKFLLKSAAKKLDEVLKNMQTKDSIGEYKVIFTTYDQLNTLKGQTTERRRFIDHFAQGNYLILDESHTAGGQGTETKEGEELNRAAFVRGLVGNAFGTFFSSATYAKRPDVMDLYSSTDMNLAVENGSDLAEAIKSGGIPMQQIVANMLTQVGQYIRRERTFEGVSYDTVDTKVNKETAEKMATSLRDILSFSRAVQVVVKRLQADLDLNGAVGESRSERTTIQSSTFSSKMHSLIGQMLLSLKADATVKFAIERIEAGEKPVITVANTMGSFLQEYAKENNLKPGDPINLSFKDMFLNYLEKQRTIKIKEPGAKKGTPYRLTDENLGPAVTAEHNKIKSFIINAGFGAAPMSPIDYIHNGLRQAGYTSDEITGRTLVINNQDGISILATRVKDIEQKNNAIDGFNNGTIKALIINQSGSTGISLHASEKFANTDKRHMIIAQADSNIDVHMQTLGRVLRTGQVQPPAYSQMMADIPAEIRPASVLLKKMASLNANTTASRKSSVTAEGIVDFMNDYGGQVAQEYLRDNSEVYEALGGREVITLLEDSTEGTEEDIRKFTGYIPLFPLKQQEEIYKDLTDRYNDLLERENSMGSNKLEAKAEDLDAKTLSSEPITPDKGDPSLFAQPAYMERIDVKRTVKPLSKTEVEDFVKTNLDGKSAQQKNMELLSGVQERLDAYTYKALEDLRAKEADPVRIDRFTAQTGLQFQHVKSILKNYPIGTPISVTNAKGVFLYGVVTNLENKKKTTSPVAGSDWKMQVTLANGDARAITINFSQIGSNYQLKQENYIDWYNPETEKGESIRLMDLFDKGANVRREKRWMVTGNILAGFSSPAVKNQGQIMSFTKNDGTTGQGILMPRTYDFEKSKKDAPIRLTKASDALRFMDEVGGVVTSADNVLRIVKSGRNYLFSVPSSKKEGGTYHQDQKLTGILRNDFYKTGSIMTARVYDSATAEKAIEYILNDRGDTLIAANPKEKAREMFAPPKPTVTPSVVVSQEMKDRIAAVHKEKVAEHAAVRRNISKLQRAVVKGQVSIDVQRQLTELNQLAKELTEEKKATAERKDTPENFLNRALTEFNKGNISKDVLDVIQYVYNQSPSLLNGLKLSVTKGGKESYNAAGVFDALNKIVRLYKESGAVNAGTIRHELMHSLEQLMDPQTRQALVEAWRASLEKAIRKNTDSISQRYFSAVLDYVNNPTEANFAAAMDVLPSQEMYQYINPSEYWAVNAEPLLAAKMGNPWKRFVQAIKQVMEGMKKIFGFDNRYTVYKTFNDLIKGEKPRTHNQMLVDMIGSMPQKTQFLYDVKDTDDLLAKHARNDAPIHTSNTNMDKLLGGAQEAKNIAAKAIKSPVLAANNMIGNLDRAVLYTRVKNTDFTAGLTAADAERYGRMLEDSDGRAVASVAMNQALKATRIGTQVVLLGKLVFDSTNQMFHAVKDKFSMANIISLKHEFEKEIGTQRAANVIQAYFEAKRSRSIVEEYLKREGQLEDLKTEQMDPATPPDRQLDLLQKIAEAEDDFKNIGIALQKVNMTDEAIDDFIKLEDTYPVLAKMMQNWNSVNKNMIDNMELSRMISKERADSLRAIEDYVPWQRIMDDQTDVHAPIYSTKGVRNISREQRFKEGKTDLDIDDIVDNMLHNVMVTTRNAIKNYAANRIAQEYGLRNDKNKLKVFPNEDHSRGIVKILVSGRKINIQIPDMLIAQSIIGIENIQIPMGNVLSALSNGLRRSITFSGVFQLKQLFMDAPTAALVTGVKNPLALYGGVFGSFIKGLHQKDPVVKLLKSYGIGGYHSSARTGEHQYRQEIGLLNKSAFAYVTNFLDKVSDASDFAQRRAIYIRVMKETGGFPVGGDQRKAILSATNVIDFDKRGNGVTAQTLNRTIAFMNAYAQQLDVLVQALAEPVAGGIEAMTGQKFSSVSGGLRGASRATAIGRLVKVAGLLASTSLLYAMAIGDDDEYNKMDDQTKMRNFVIPRSFMKTLGYDHTILIPMHTSASYFFKAIPELLYNKITKEGTKNEVDNQRLRTALKHGAVDALLGPLGSGPVPTGIKPFAEIILNHNFYTGSAVTPQSMKDLASFRQYNGATSELGKWLSYASGLGDEKSRLLNPMQADHVMRGLAGSVASIAMWGSNMFSGRRASPEERNNILYGSFIAPEVPRGREDLFYDLKTESDTAMGTFKDLMKKGHPEEAKQWFEENKGAIQASGFTAAAGKALIDINANIRRLEDLPETKMSPTEKHKQINFYKTKKEEILEQTIKFRLKAGM